MKQERSGQRLSERERAGLNVVRQRRLFIMYQPNFCAECGERIARARWHVRTNRRFCPQCAPRFRSARMLLPLLAGAILFIVGLFAGRAARPSPPPLVIERGQPSIAPTQTAQALPTQANAKTAPQPTTNRPAPNSAGAAIENAGEASETVSICGAMTKKGTPCRRRVRGTGRCWQHKGQPAAISVAERLVTEK
jgi:hypothetical protein